MSTATPCLSDTLLAPGIYVEELEPENAAMPAITREIARWALKQICQRELDWLVFEDHHPKTWAQAVQNLRGFLMMLWAHAALQGKHPAEAFFIRCDMTTMTPEDIREGTLICLVGMAPVKPSEFVTLRVRIRLSPRP